MRLLTWRPDSARMVLLLTAVFGVMFASLHIHPESFRIIAVGTALLAVGLAKKIAAIFIIGLSFASATAPLYESFLAVAIIPVLIGAVAGLFMGGSSITAPPRLLLIIVVWSVIVTLSHLLVAQSAPDAYSFVTLWCAAVITCVAAWVLFHALPPEWTLNALMFAGSITAGAFLLTVVAGGDVGSATNWIGLYPTAWWGNSNMLGAILLVPLTITTARAFSDSGRVMLWSALALMSMAALIATLSRSALLGAIAVLVVTALRRSLLALVLVLCAGATILWIVPIGIQSRWSYTFADARLDTSSQTRLDLWASVLEQVREAPLSLIVPLTDSTIPLGDGQFLYPHNLLLSIGSRLGFMLAIVIALAVLMLIVRLWRAGRTHEPAQIAAALLIGLTLASMFGEVALRTEVLAPSAALIVAGLASRGGEKRAS